jgi:aspartyl-tRNA(Asn)/glutamyl-tRNA(Gln) amidotransferase subunit A
MIQGFVERINGGENAVDAVSKALEECERVQREFNCFEEICGDRAIERARELDKKIKRGFKGALSGVALTVKDSLCVSGARATAGSRVLRDYKPPFTATAVERAEEEGGIVVAKCRMDEFGFGSFCANTESVPLNPFDKKRVCGGSSGGSACATRALSVPTVGIAENTGGSITCPSAFCGVSGFTPTYGRVSRWGLIDYASSLDKVGSMGKDFSDAGILLQAMQGFDERDSTSSRKGEFGKGEKIGKKIGIPREMVECCEDGVKQLFWKKIYELEANGFECEEFQAPLIEYCAPCYYVIAMAEASTNLAKYCGLRYGMQGKPEGKHFRDYFSEEREGFGDEAKRRILLGSFVRKSGYRERYYEKALRIREKIREEYWGVFKKVDFITAPSMPCTAPTFEEVGKLTPLQCYSIDYSTIPFVLGNLPHSSIPVGSVGGMPIGMQFAAASFKEGNIWEISEFAQGLFH